MKAGMPLPRLVLFISYICIGVFLGVGGYTFYYARGASYLSNDPAACVNCHIMREQYDGWQKASHHLVAACNDCHVPHSFIPKYLTKLENGFWHSKGFTLQDFHEPIRMRPQSKAIVLENCLECHREIVSPLLWHPMTVEQQVDCIECHRSVGHGPAQ